MYAPRVSTLPGVNIPLALGLAADMAPLVLIAASAMIGAFFGCIVALVATRRKRSSEAPAGDAMHALVQRLDKAEVIAVRRQVQTEALLNIFSVLQPIAPFPAFEGSRVAPDCAKILLNSIFDRRPAILLEFGGGVSTLVCGYAMKRLGRGRIITVEHDPGYTPALRENVRRHGLEQIVTVVEAPLEPLEPGQFAGPLADPQGGPPHSWYRRAAWLDALATLGVSDKPGALKIDMVFVDGPGGGKFEPLSRWPAVPAVHALLSPTAMVILDDANRPGESECVRIWASDFPDLKADPTVKTAKGTAILRRIGS